MAITNPGGNLNSVPAPQKQTLSNNYIDFTAQATQGWAQQYLPDLMEKEAEVFGPRTISGFLSQVGAEEPMTSDQVIWSEQGRLHLSFKGHVSHLTTNGGQIDILTDIDGRSITAAKLAIRVNDTVIVANSEGVEKCLVSNVSAGGVIDVKPYEHATLSAAGFTSTHSDSSTGTTVLVYGSEFAKGVGYNQVGGPHSDSRNANEPRFQTFTNKPIIMKDYYEVSGSDASRIGWVEVSTESGQSGYLWYLKAEADTRARFTDYIEMSMLESVKGDDTDIAETAVDDFLYGSDDDDTVGTEGLFAAIESRGNVTSGITGVNGATDLAEFDAILAEFDKQGAIEEYMMFVNRATSLAMDDMLASMNSYGAGGTSYGVFDNDEDMALNLGFSGFRRGSYDFYKSDFRYLNDLATRGGVNEAGAGRAIRGVLIPAGTSTVYDQQLGSNLKRPFLHVRYRASATDDRRMKTWVTGSVGAATSALDAMQLHFLTERCLITQGANNFMLMK
jgi:hypothetical protein